MVHLQQLAAQSNLVLLINEGTASSAEVFASALHDNGRAVALIGSKTYGKGLVQHTFPMPDGGGLRLTVAEYLTPSLHHVTHVGGAQFDRVTGAWIGGGILPDVECDSRQGIPANIGAELCVGMVLDALNEAAENKASPFQKGEPTIVPPSREWCRKVQMEACYLRPAQQQLAVWRPGSPILKALRRRGPNGQRNDRGRMGRTRNKREGGKNKTRGSC
jgi:hypothetical protein